VGFEPIILAGERPQTYALDRGCFPEIKRPEREVDDDSSPSMAEVKNEWSSTPTPPSRLHGFYREKIYKKFVCFIL
jgi:hypothetical protein